MQVLVRIRQSSDIQELFFGSNAPRPYLLINGVTDENDVINVIKAYIHGDNRFLSNFRIKKYMKPYKGEFEYSLMTSKGLSKVVYLGYIS